MAGDKAFYGYDGNGNVTLLTDANGQESARYRYDAFGVTLEAIGTKAADNPYRFSTKEQHGASGLYKFGFRFYSPGMGRWINRDPLGEAGGVNLYAMVGNNPVNDVDEYGLVGRTQHNLDPNSFLGRVVRALDQIPWWADPMLGASSAGRIAARAAAQKAASQALAQAAARIAAQRAAAQVAAQAVARNSRILRGWAQSKGWVRKSGGGPETWGVVKPDGSFSWRLKLKPLPSANKGLSSSGKAGQTGSYQPRFDARLNEPSGPNVPNQYTNPLTGRTGPDLSHQPLDIPPYPK